ncbi:hypothetical protein PBI_LUCKY3_28 [Microbacterium phage Lucky3]|uniref:Uncharacterized protein n=2 Tax=Kojivirus golden TaxID=2560590 RepID=A0A2P1CGH4_9CAUD|nr:hypothetical protein FDJ42_gp28 [Microbacterium phage Golden]AVJ49775.1 hypothetical protein PBI_GOLDEN_28 [Microbacterium phage Golden]AVJ50085.1 hypothetical protein PBI_LUCKY3_28 [Microbacterium phage Lucky3]
MAHKVNLNVHTQARAYQAGYQDALSDLVDALVEGGDVNFMIDALEMKINRPQVADTFRTYYASK